MLTFKKKIITIPAKFKLFDVLLHCKINKQQTSKQLLFFYIFVLLIDESTSIKLVLCILLAYNMGHNMRKVLEFVSLYLTRLFKLFCELWPIYYMIPTYVIVLENDVNVA